MTTSSTVQQASPTDVVAAIGHLLCVNGHTTVGTIHAVETVAARYRMPVQCLPEWSHLTVVDHSGRHLFVVPAQPEGVHMARVSAVLDVVTDVLDGDEPPAPREVLRRLEDARSLPPSPTPVFAVACATGACALAAIFGATDPWSYVLIAVSAALGGVLRRVLGGRGLGIVGQALVAAVLAGLVGALAVQLGISGWARLIAVCPAIVLVPGPHLLNGAIDVAERRIGMGVARLTYGALILVAITLGLVVGLALGGSSLPSQAPGVGVALPVEVVAGAVAAASYPVYFSMRWGQVVWPVLAATLGHAVRWVAMQIGGADIVVGALLTCLVVGLFVGPIAHRRRMPFAGAGFAAVVALVPGVYVFRSGAGLFTLVDDPSVAAWTAVGVDVATAGLTLMAMVIGLVVGLRVSTAVMAHTAAEKHTAR